MQLFKVGIFSDKELATMPCTLLDTTTKVIDVPVVKWTSTYSLKYNDYAKIEDAPTQAHIRFETFDDRTQEVLVNKLNEFVKYSSEAQKKDFLVIDVRGNGGGMIHYPVNFISGLCNVKVTPFTVNFTLYSPGVIQSKLYELRGVKTHKEQVQEQIVALEKIDTMMQENPLRDFGITEDNSVASSEAFKDYKGKIILIMGRGSASAAEIFPYLFKSVKNITILGENSCSCGATCNPLTYVLPNSKSYVYLPSVTFLPNVIDDGYGLSPDYWVSSDKELYDDLQAMGLEANLLQKVKEMDK